MNSPVRRLQWRDLGVLGVLWVGVLLALPNGFGYAPALQIAKTHGQPLDDHLWHEVHQTLVQHQITPTAHAVKRAKLLIHFASTQDQTRARDALRDVLTEAHTVALHWASRAPSWLARWGIHPMKLGLDLRGGVHFLLEVDTDTVIQRHALSTVAAVTQALREQHGAPHSVQSLPTHPASIQVILAQHADPNEAVAYLNTHFSDWSWQQDVPDHIQGQLLPQALRRMRNQAMEQSILTLRRRVNELEVSEALVQRQGNRQIVVELPGIQDITRAKELIGKTASIAFHMVARNTRWETQSGRRYTDASGHPVWLETQPLLTGEAIVDARSDFDTLGQPMVTIQLGGGASTVKRFSEATRQRVGQSMATVYSEVRFTDRTVHGQAQRVKRHVDQVISVATIQEALGHHFRITGLRSMQEARDLALLLRAGALPAPIDMVQERTIGPSLGQHNIDRGLRAVGLGVALVVVFMLIYYRMFGLIANLALLMNLVLLVALLSLIGATLTLPGIAGMVLTLGMAVDANVLIFERIREELRGGLSARRAIVQGFDRAFVTILDANVTTFLVAWVLYAVGTGPVKGFAITLMMGLFTSMFTAITGSRMWIDWLYTHANRPIHRAIGLPPET